MGAQLSMSIRGRPIASASTVLVLAAGLAAASRWLRFGRRIAPAPSSSSANQAERSLTADRRAVDEPEKEEEEGEWDPANFRTPVAKSAPLQSPEKHEDEMRTAEGSETIDESSQVSASEPRETSTNACEEDGSEWQPERQWRDARPLIAEGATTASRCEDDWAPDLSWYRVILFLTWCICALARADLADEQTVHCAGCCPTA